MSQMILKVCNADGDGKPYSSKVEAGRIQLTFAIQISSFSVVITQ